MIRLVLAVLSLVLVLAVLSAPACDSNNEAPAVADAAASGADASVDAAVPAPPDAGPGPAVLGGGSTCDLPLLARQLAESENTTPPFDCGTAVLADPLSRWVDFSGCLVDHLNAKSAFHGAFELDNTGEGDKIGIAFIGIAGPPFVLKQIFWDSDPTGGTGAAPPRAQRHQCENPAVRDACTAEIGWVCMGCADQKNPDLVDLCPGWAMPGMP